MFRGSLGADDLQQRHGDADYFVPPYAYDAEPASTVEASVRAGACGATRRLTSHL